MKLKNIKFDQYRNLNNFECSFGDSNVIAFIGNNGSGKSNVLEAIAQSFVIAKNIDNIKYISYLFDMEYEIDGNLYRIENNNSTFHCYKNGKADIKNLRYFLPKVIFTYYAGDTDRLNSYAKRIEDDRFNRELKKDENIDFKMITDLSLKDFSLAFLSSYIFNTDCFAKIKEMLNFDSVNEHRIRMKLKRPYWASNGSSVKTLWNVKEGSFTDIFYNKLLSYDEEEYGSGAFVELIREEDEFVLGAGSIELLREIANTPLELYTQLKAFMEADVLDEILIDVRKGEDSFPLTLFSEGEKQLANLLLLLDLTKEYKALFLLDEFDSYLHPTWQREFVKLINNTDIRGQIIFTTHSPASISKVQRENVFIMKNGEVFQPLSDTFNRSLEEIMEEQMEISLRPPEYTELVQEFRNAIMHNNRNLALAKLDQIKEVVGENDPFFITARIALERMES